MFSENFDFLIKGKFDKYAGEWIAVSGSRIIANAGSASEVISLAEKITSNRTTIMRVPEKEEILLI
jgi:hypothetical protein